MSDKNSVENITLFMVVLFLFVW